MSAIIIQRWIRKRLFTSRTPQTNLESIDRSIEYMMSYIRSKKLDSYKDYNTNIVELPDPKPRNKYKIRSKENN